MLCWVFTLLLCYGNFQLIAIIVRIKIIIVISPDSFEVLCFCVCVRVSICKVSQLELFGPGSGDAKFLKHKYMLRVAQSLWTFGCKLFRGANQIRRWMRELKFWRRRFAKGGRKIINLCKKTLVSQLVCLSIKKLENLSDKYSFTFA